MISSPHSCFSKVEYISERTRSSRSGSGFDDARFDALTVRAQFSYIDATYRTLARRESRAVVGSFFGGRGALKLAMSHAEVFSVAYAMHPVATGTGDVPWASLEIDWQRMHAAKSYAELGGLRRTQIFWAIHQAFSPSLAKPPCY